MMVTGTRGRRARAVIAVLAASTLLAACSGTSTPKGWNRVEQGWLAVDVPEDWVAVSGQAAGYMDLVLQDSEKDPTVQLVASTEYGDVPAGTTLVAVRTDRPFGQLDDPGLFSDVERDDEQVTKRWDFTYEDGEYRGVAWATHDAGLGRTVFVAVTGTELGDETVKQIEASIEVLDGEPAEAPAGA
jgi:ABC-type glycerol-3-phosphate transport system substrate-binding protein